MNPFLYSKRSQVTAALVGVLLLSGMGWAIKTGHIKIRADVAYPQGISGVVTDRDGSPLSGATVTDSLTGRTVTTGSNGSYSLTLPVEDTAIWYQKDGPIFNPNFPDVPSSYWAIKYIGALKNAGIVSGYADGFHPTEQVTRAQMAVFLARALAKGDSNVPAATGQRFNDVPASYWAYKYIEYLAANTLIGGYADGGFHPEEKVTRAQMAVFISKTLKYAPATKNDPTFKDVPDGYWAYGFIEKLAYLGIASGYADGSYKPETVVTRDQMCVFIGRAFASIPLTNGGYEPQYQHFSIPANQTVQFDVALALSGQVGSVRGFVKNSGGTAVAGAKVVLTLKPFLGETYESVTATDGSFVIYNIPEGPYPYFVTSATGPRLSLDVNQNYGESFTNVYNGETSALNIFVTP